MKLLCCAQCGCERNLLLQAKVRIQSQPFEVTYKWLCFACFLKMFNLYDRETGVIDKQLIFETVEQVKNLAK
jgi:hypothetical protein